MMDYCLCKSSMVTFGSGTSYFVEGKYYYIVNDVIPNLNQTEQKEIFLLGPFDEVNSEIENIIFKNSSDLGKILSITNSSLRFAYKKYFSEVFYDLKEIRKLKLSKIG